VKRGISFFLYEIATALTGLRNDSLIIEKQEKTQNYKTTDTC